MIFLTRTGMDDLDRDNLLVLTVFGGSVVAVIVGYLLAWRAKRTAYRRAGSFMTAVVAGFAGLFMLAWLIAAVMPLPPPNGTSIWGPIIALLVFSPLPLGAFYICAKFIRQALRDERKSPLSFK
jgi:ABC-type Co2+ transport system permease subunit